eukprot:TRINITY_DN9825_c0_g1_i2.p1 TRINITY_DN9825_c0_g1~~TRINITY_DN9825_c0_g1_i2.p1  ORF type:complete len:485 (-),score=44.34 TRINITY_DN9825_c0_g1_i2:51-1505(-)
MSVNELIQEAKPTFMGASLFSNECRKPLTWLSCLSAFRRCSYYPISDALPSFFVLPLPKSPCLSVCETAKRECKGKYKLDCNTTDPDTQSDSYPKTETTVNINGNSYEVPCNKNGSASEVEAPNSCPYPFTLIPWSRLVCYFSCNSYFWSDGVHVPVDLIPFILSIPGMILCVLGLIPMLLLPQRREFPQTLQTATTLICFVFSIFMFVSYLESPKPRCDDGRPAETHYPPCVFQGVIWQICVETISTLWTTIAIMMFLIVTLEIDAQQLVKYQWITWLGVLVSVAWPVILSLAKSQYTQVSVLSWCMPVQDGFTYWTIYVARRSLHTIIVVMCIGVTFGRLVYYHSQSNSNRKLLRNLPIAVFGICCFVVFVSSIILISRFAVQEDALYRDISHTVECNVAKGESDSPQCRPDEQYFGVNYGGWLFFNVVLTSLPIIIPILFSCNPTIFEFWKRVLKGDFSVIDISTFSGTTSHGSRRSSSKG